MNDVLIPMKKLEPLAKLPTRASRDAAGFDLYACLSSGQEPIRILPGERALIPTGISMAIPVGWEGQVRARSGLALRSGVFVLNGPGTIDADYRQGVGVILANFAHDPFEVRHGDRIAQIVFQRVPQVQAVEVEDLPATESDRRGGFGSTGA